MRGRRSHVRRTPPPHPRPHHLAGHPGLAFRNSDGEITITPRRPLIDDLDTLPLPAYDAIDIRHYGRRSANHPRLVSVEHSRGCMDSCSFCILWKQMGESANGNGRLRPRLRTKSPERSFDEVHGRSTAGGVDVARMHDTADVDMLYASFVGGESWASLWTPADSPTADEMYDALGFDQVSAVNDYGTNPKNKKDVDSAVDFLMLDEAHWDDI